MTRHLVGSVQRISTTFRDQAEALADPTTVTIKVCKPDGTESSEVWSGVDGEVVRVSLGVFRRDVPIDVEGRWLWRSEGAGAIVAVDEGVFDAWSDYLE